ncbi:MAG: CPBP family intramembrane metalloprotease [Anaerolineales bacterium]|nr:CPBP family intramembrane metalloprotease [Anaerolineales bacterium]
MKIAYDGWLFINKEKITIGVLIILFALRLGNSYLVEKLWGDYTLFYQGLIILPLLVFVIWVNQKSLHLLQIDKPFILLFALSSFLLCFYFWGSIVEYFLLASLLLFFRLLFDENLIFERDVSLPKYSTFLFTVIGLIPLILLGIVIESLSYFPNLFAQGVTETTWAISVRLWNAIYEVMLFWGILWMALKKWGMNNVAIIFIQAVLFSLAHINLFPSKAFWITMPILGLWLGYLASRSKSLTPTTITYFVYNTVTTALQLALNSSS